MGFQLMFGAFTAGLDAGKGFNTYPLMNGQFIADIALSLDPVWKNFIENGAMIQFVHRWLGALVFFGVIILALLSMKTELKGSSFILVLITAFQFILGVMTLVNGVPIVLGSMHQVVAVIMFLTLVYFVHITRLKTM
jgi:cytochrome c oxidase assembly protein subunit 15